MSKDNEEILFLKPNPAQNTLIQQGEVYIDKEETLHEYYKTFIFSDSGPDISIIGI
ncbi:MAG TPA: hypothetical protein VKO67_01580 [Smithellaceae bacterium]|nr:hypothetical protein [Smithellaceae bacterium]